MLQEMLPENLSEEPAAKLQQEILTEQRERAAQRVAQKTRWLENHRRELEQRRAAALEQEELRQIHRERVQRHPQAPSLLRRWDGQEVPLKDVDHYQPAPFDPNLPPSFRNHPKLWSIPGYGPQNYRWVLPEEFGQKVPKPKLAAKGRKA